MWLCSFCQSVILLPLSNSFDFLKKWTLVTKGTLFEKYIYWKKNVVQLSGWHIGIKFFHWERSTYYYSVSTVLKNGAKCGKIEVPLMCNISIQIGLICFLIRDCKTWSPGRTDDSPKGFWLYGKNISCSWDSRRTSPGRDQFLLSPSFSGFFVFFFFQWHLWVGETWAALTFTAE